MPKRIFDEDSDNEDVGITTNNEYAKNYNIWRKKEELNKLKTKYGEENLNIDEEESSSSSSDDEDGSQLTEEVEKEFFKTLSALKNRDPKIYDEHTTFFEDRTEQGTQKTTKKKADKSMFLKDYERKLLLENGGMLEDENEEMGNGRSSSPTFETEQNLLKKQIIERLEEVDDADIGTKQRTKTTQQKEEEEADYIKWLTSGQGENIDESTKSDLKPLKEYWNSPNLDEGEKFLRDYILNKKFLSKEDENYIPTYDEIIHDSDESLSHDEDEIEKQEMFEHKYNFRYEEPDQDFIKRYPRTMENSLRKKDTRRKEKRAEIKERKTKEKEEKFAEIRKLQELKRKEIEEKIEKLKEITGNDQIDFDATDIDGDFDPEAHDKKMRALFNDDFYEGSEEEQKPVFPDIDEELEIESWDHWEGNEDGESNNAPHCEDDNFNMDADYDPSQGSSQELIENSKGKKKKKRKSKFAQALATPKPKYDPYDKNYEKYFEEYYKLDCEDIIGDIPCRFKYREVIPNDFGLTVEEILLAKDRELNKWCSLKKSVQRRPEHIEKYEQKVYAQKGQNINLKKKILPSLFSTEPDEPSTSAESVQQKPAQEEVVQNNTENSSTKKGKKRKIKQSQNTNVLNQDIVENNTDAKDEASSNKKQKNVENEIIVEATTSGSQEIKKKNKKKKKTKGTKTPNNNANTEISEISKIEDSKQKLKKNKPKLKNKVIGKNKNVKKKTGINKSSSIETDISDSRLAAYGINPKKFKNKLKYKNRNE